MFLFLIKVWFNISFIYKIMYNIFTFVETCKIFIQHTDPSEYFNHDFNVSSASLFAKWGLHPKLWSDRSFQANWLFKVWKPLSLNHVMLLTFDLIKNKSILVLDLFAPSVHKRRLLVRHKVYMVPDLTFTEKWREILKHLFEHFDWKSKRIYFLFLNIIISCDGVWIVSYS